METVDFRSSYASDVSESFCIRKPDRFRCVLHLHTSFFVKNSCSSAFVSKCHFFTKWQFLGIGFLKILTTVDGLSALCFPLELCPYVLHTRMGTCIAFLWPSRTSNIPQSLLSDPYSWTSRTTRVFCHKENQSLPHQVIGPLGPQNPTNQV